ncbi:MAG TPA: hypothetical protein VFC78_14885 [Tepidisphaeraceae bacterium]|nr:hypothetical protein [Tepidisphaeraceae bacterium]
MSQNPQEITEAKLAAFIDGELGADERAEIEALLARKPQYRPLLAELGRTRDLLRTLPRETAPPELAEAFNTQLERSVLLDGAGQYDEPRMRVGAWPKILARAAIFLMIVGLAAAVYLELPNHPFPRIAGITPGHSPSQAASQPGSRTDDEAIDGGSELGKAGAHGDRAIEANPGGPQGPDRNARLSRAGNIEAMKNAVGSPAAAGPGAGVNAAPPAAPDPLDALANDVSQDPGVQQLLDNPTEPAQVNNKQAAADTNAVVMVVRSSDPAQARNEVAAFLSRNNIAYQAAPAPVELALNSAISQNSVQALASQNDATGIQEGLNARQRRATTRMAKGDTEDRGLPKKDANESAAAANTAQSTRDYSNESGSDNSPKPARNENTNETTLAQKAGGPGTGGGLADQRPSGAAPPAAATSGAAPGAVGGAATSALSAQQSVAQSANTLNQQQLVQASGYGGLVDKLYIARQLSPRQARELNECLSRNGTVRQAGVSRGSANGYAYNNSANNSTYAINQNTRGATGIGNRENGIGAGPANSYARPQASYGGSPAAAQPPSPGPATRPVDVLVGPGNPTRQAAGRIADKQEHDAAARSKDQGAASGKLASTLSESPREQNVRQTQMPTTQRALAIQPATAPAPADPDAPVDVVIVVQNAALSTTQPSQTK